MANIKVEYVLFSSAHVALESKQVLFKQADYTDTSIAGTYGKNLNHIYNFYTSLTKGLSYTVAIKLTFTMRYECVIEGIDPAVDASVNVDEILVWNSPGSPL